MGWCAPNNTNACPAKCGEGKTLARAHSLALAGGKKSEIQLKHKIFLSETATEKINPHLMILKVELVIWKMRCFINNIVPATLKLKFC